MKKRKTILSILAFFAILLAVVSCKDDFSEEDFLNLQYKLARSQDSLNFVQEMERLRQEASMDSSMYVLQSEINLAMQMRLDSAQVNYQKQLLQDMGLLMSLTIQVTEDKKPVSGVTVDLANLGAGAKKASVISDTNGMVRFQDVVVGGNHIALSGPNYLSASVSVFFADNNTTSSTGYIIPIRRNENMALPIFADGSSVTGESATIKGTVTIETDLTNDQPEVLDSVRIAANISDFLQDIVWPNSGWVNSYNFSQPGAFGVAITDSAGNYKMMVPASTTNDYDVQLIIPSFEMDQTLAIAQRDGKELANREITTVKAAFGPEHSGSYTGIPFVRGTKVTFDDPGSAGGSGLEFSYTPIPTSLGTGNPVWTLSTPTSPYSYSAFTCSDSSWVYARFQVTERGKNYTTSPTITVSDGTASSAKMYASLIGRFRTVTSTGGAGYTPSSTVSASIWFKSVEVDDDTDTNKYTVNSFTITVPANGVLPTNLIDIVAATGGTTGISTNFSSINYGDFSYRIIEWGIDFSGGGTPTTDATGSVTLDAAIEYIRLQEGGNGYTSTPTVTFSGGGATIQAEAKFDRFETYYYIDIASGGTGYTGIPNMSQHFYSGSRYWWASESPNTLNSIRGGDVNNSYCDFDSDLGSIVNNLVINGGVIEWKNPSFTYMTYTCSQAAPTMLLPDLTARPWYADVDIFTSGSQEGEFNSLSNAVAGAGYAGPFSCVIEPSISGLPGSGASIELTNGYYSGSEYIWQGNYTIISRGAGYLHNANQQAYVGYGASSSVNNTVPGSVYIRNIMYGTGQVLENVGGE